MKLHDHLKKITEAQDRILLAQQRNLVRIELTDIITSHLGTDTIKSATRDAIHITQLNIFGYVVENDNIMDTIHAVFPSLDDKKIALNNDEMIMNRIASNHMAGTMHPIITFFVTLYEKCKPILKENRNLLVGMESLDMESIPTHKVLREHNMHHYFSGWKQNCIIDLAVDHDDAILIRVNRILAKTKKENQAVIEVMARLYGIGINVEPLIKKLRYLAISHGGDNATCTHIINNNFKDYDDPLEFIEWRINKAGYINEIKHKVTA